MSSALDTHPLVSRLRARMDDLHLTQREAAEALGVSERTVSYWMTTDTTPQPRHRRAIVSWLEEATAGRGMTAEHIGADGAPQAASQTREATERRHH